MTLTARCVIRRLVHPSRVRLPRCGGGGGTGRTARWSGTARSFGEYSGDIKLCINEFLRVSRKAFAGPHREVRVQRIVLVRRLVLACACPRGGGGGGGSGIAAARAHRSACKLAGVLLLLRCSAQLRS